MSSSLGRRLGKALAIVTLGVIAALGLSACGSNDPHDPGTFSVANQQYCGFVFSPSECSGHVGIPVLMAGMDAYPGAYNYQVLHTAYLWRVSNHSYYGSRNYYNRIPASVRPANYKAFNNTVAMPFNKSTATLQKTYKPGSGWAKSVSSGNRSGKIVGNNGRTNNNGPTYNPGPRNPKQPVYSGGPNQRVQPPAQQPVRRAPVVAPAAPRARR